MCVSVMASDLSEYYILDGKLRDDIMFLFCFSNNQAFFLNKLWEVGNFLSDEKLSTLYKK